MANKVSFIIQLKNQFSGVADKVNRQFVKIKNSANNASRSVSDFAKKTQASMASMGRSALKAGAVMTAAITVPIALMGRSMVKAASDAEETANKFSAVFKAIAPAANKTADEFAKKFSLAGSTARKMIGDTGDLLVGFKFGAKQALGLSIEVQKLSLDLDSFQNFAGGAEGASLAITKALLGETESMKSLGVSIQQNTKEFRAQVKATMRVNKVTQKQAKALIILKDIQSQTQAATGDYIKTLNNSYAGSVRKNIQANIKFKESFGNLLLPIATKMVDAMTKLADRISNLSPPMKKLVLVLAGLVAIGGPLLLLLGGIALAVSVISLPVLVVVAAVGLLIAAGAMLWLNWKDIVSGAKLLWADFADLVEGTVSAIGDAFTMLWDGAKAGLVAFVNIGIGLINSLLAPLDFVAQKLGLGTIKIQSIQAPSAPMQNQNGFMKGEITVAAEKGTSVRSTRARNSGAAKNIGLNMVTQ